MRTITIELSDKEYSRVMSVSNKKYNKNRKPTKMDL